MAESIDRIISDGAFEQLKRLLEELAACDMKMQEFIRTVDGLRKSLEGAQGIKAVSREYARLTEATEQLNGLTKEKLELEKKVGKECDKLAVYVARETDEAKENARQQDVRRTKMQQLADSMVEQQRQLEAVNAQLKDARREYGENGRESESLKQKVSDLTIVQAQLRDGVASSTKEFKNMLAESQNEETSLKAKSAQLQQLKSEYDSLSESERGNAAIGGELRDRMAEIERTLKEARGATSGYTMKVGETEISVGRLKTELKFMLESLQAQTFAFHELEDEIGRQSAKVQTAAAAHGTASDEYRRENAQLEALKDAHRQAGEQIEEMRRKAGQVKDTIADTADAVKAWSSDTANVDAVVTGMDTMVQGYTALKAGMAAVGVESEELMNVFAKIQILQQGVNAVQKIADNLTKEGIFKSKMKAVVEKMRLAMTEAQAKAQAKATAAETAHTASVSANTSAETKNSTALAVNNTATAGAIVATGGLATAETAATATTFTLAGAVKAVGVAIKSIPVIGWILAAVAGLVTLGKLVYNMLSAEKELTAEQKLREDLLKRENEIRTAATESVQKEKMLLDVNIGRMGSLKEGTEEWKDAVKKAADTLGVTSEWLTDNREKVDELEEAWYRCRMQQALADKYAEESANAAVEAEKQILAVRGGLKEREEAIDAISQLSDAEKKRWKAAEHLVRSGNELEKKEARKTINEMRRKTREYADEISRTFNQKAAQAANLAATYGSELDKAKRESDRQEQSGKSGADTYKDRLKHAEDVGRRIAELEAKTDREIYELKRKNLQTELEKEMKQYGMSAAEKASITRKYALEEQALQEEYLKKRTDRIDSANREAAETLMALNEQRLQNSGITEEQLTESLVENERRRCAMVLEQNEASFRKEVEDLEEGSAEYLAVKAKWDAKNEKQAYDSTQREAAIRKKGFDEILKDIAQRTKDDENELTISTADGNVSASDAEEQRRQLKIDGIRREIEAYDELRDKYAELGMTEEEYTSKMLELNAQLATAQKEQHDATMAQLAAQREARQELALTIGDSISAIGNAIADGVEDERQKVVIQQSLAMAQVMMEQAVAISKAVSSATEGDPYTVAIRIAAAVGAVVASFISARNAMSQAKQSVNAANAYAEGTDYHRGGPAVVGEEFKPELVVIGRRKFVVDQPTFFDNLPVGAKVIPLERLVAAQNGGNGSIDLSEIVSGVNRLGSRPLVKIDVGENVYSHIVKGASQSRILNSQFSH